MESNTIELYALDSSYDVLYSERINLNQKCESSHYELRAVLCDNLYMEKESKYRYKEKMITRFIKERKMSSQQALKYAQEKLGYIPSEIRSL